jgi:hypothetical protein
MFASAKENQESGNNKKREFMRLPLQNHTEQTFGPGKTDAVRTFTICTEARSQTESAASWYRLGFDRT